MGLKLKMRFQILLRRQTGQWQRRLVWCDYCGGWVQQRQLQPSASINMGPAEQNTAHWCRDDAGMIWGVELQQQGGRMTNRGAVSNTEAPQCSSRGSPSHPSISQVTDTLHTFHLVSNLYVSTFAGKYKNIAGNQNLKLFTVILL